MVTTPNLEDVPASASAEEPRRGFFVTAAGLAVAALAFAAPLISGLVALLNPLRSTGAKGQAGEDQAMIRLTTLDALPADGTPRKFPVVTERTDAWTRSVEPVGAVYVRRTGADTVQVLQIVCPHAGCSVEFKQMADGEAGGSVPGFVCPCHKAKFAVDGKRLEADSQSPRDMDALTVEVRGGSEVWIRFANFKTGTPDQVPLT